MSDNPWRGPEATGEGTAAPGRSWRRRVLILGAIGLAAFFLIGVNLPWLTRDLRQIAVREQCRNNLKQIGLALRNYHEAYGEFPPACTVDDSGRPLHSWRTLILPYLELRQLYDRIDLAQPWDSPVNRVVFNSPVNAYRCPDASGHQNLCSYLAIHGDELSFPLNGSRRLQDFADPGGTVMVVEVDSDRAVPWMAPQDADAALVQAMFGESRLPHHGGSQALLADGSVRFLVVHRATPAVLRQLMSVEGDGRPDF